MGQKYIWQRAGWPSFNWQSDALIEIIGRARQTQGKVLAQAEFIGLKEQATILVEEAFSTSAIEGEKLDRDSIRSSVARRLGLPTAGLPAAERSVDGLVSILMDATASYEESLTEKRLFGWHAALFPTGYSGFQKITVGGWRKGEEPMQVVSGPDWKREVHFEAPPSKKIKEEMTEFLNWWNTPYKMDGLVRAAVAHFWFVTIHPFEDGNGRIARALTDMALAQDEKTSRRLYSLSSQINRERDDYYEILENSQKATCDVTKWISWFLELYVRSVNSSNDVIDIALSLAKFWKAHSQSALNERQVKAINRLLEAGPKGFEGGMTNRKYVSLNKVSSETAKRDLHDLESRGILMRNEAGGRSVSYSLRAIEKKV